uniref:Replication enhancer n=1 Tax=Opuntia virus 1 TaxID=2706523 RepID=A0A6C0MBV6_9GEMI|nr:replication enhancer protein [Opuntia virus 1]QHU79396.1 replication enhancer protein [Opuntia virus 1]QHU79402.1 replication enhancer protein [Opuntia virus 1]QHU79414.1 replication enhancer protein [Opuntia virus 1]QHU79420.1 replication enhancer protein [Opuntia virus 1]
MDSRTGDPITPYQAEIGTFIWKVPNPLYMKLLFTGDNTQGQLFRIRIQANHNLRKQLGLHKCWIQTEILTTLKTAIGSSFLTRFKFHVLFYLHNLGVVSINNIARAIYYFFDVSKYVYEIRNTQYDIKFLLY